MKVLVIWLHFFSFLGWTWTFSCSELNLSVKFVLSCVWTSVFMHLHVCESVTIKTKVHSLVSTSFILGFLQRLWFITSFTNRVFLSLLSCQQVQLSFHFTLTTWKIQAVTKQSNEIFSKEQQSRVSSWAYLPTAEWHIVNVLLYFRPIWKHIYFCDNCCASAGKSLLFKLTSG